MHYTTNNKDSCATQPGQALFPAGLTLTNTAKAIYGNLDLLCRGHLLGALCPLQAQEASVS